MYNHFFTDIIIIHCAFILSFHFSVPTTCWSSWLYVKMPPGDNIMPAENLMQTKIRLFSKFHIIVFTTSGKQKSKKPQDPDPRTSVRLQVLFTV